MNNCSHSVKKFEIQNPNKYEITIGRLYKCSKCKKWFSLLEVLKTINFIKG